MACVALAPPLLARAATVAGRENEGEEILYSTPPDCVLRSAMGMPDLDVDALDIIVMAGAWSLMAWCLGRG